MANDYIDMWDINGSVYDIHDKGRAQPNGVATLGSDGKVPMLQLKTDTALGVATLDENGLLKQTQNRPLVPKAKASSFQRMLFSSSYGQLWNTSIPSEFKDKKIAFCSDGEYYYIAVNSSGSNVSLYKKEALLNGQNLYPSITLSMGTSLQKLLKVFVYRNRLFVAGLCSTTSSSNTVLIAEYDKETGDLLQQCLILNCECVFFDFLPYEYKLDGIPQESTNDFSEYNCIVLSSSNKTSVVSMHNLWTSSLSRDFSSDNFSVSISGDYCVGANQYKDHVIAVGLHNQIVTIATGNSYSITNSWTKIDTNYTSISIEKFWCEPSCNTEGSGQNGDSFCIDNTAHKVYKFNLLQTENISSYIHTPLALLLSSSYLYDVCVKGKWVIPGFIGTDTPILRNLTVAYPSLTLTENLSLPTNIDSLIKIAYCNGVWLALAWTTNSPSASVYVHQLVVLKSVDGITYKSVNSVATINSSSSDCPWSDTVLLNSKLQFIGESWCVMLFTSEGNYNLIAVSDYYSLYNSEGIPAFN